MTSPISGTNVSPQRTDAAATTSKAAATKTSAKVNGDGDRDSSTKAAAGATQVTISAAGQLAAAANQEATETPAQTAKEAQGPDMQAKRLLAKEQAASKAA
jgi:enterochelin esterase-like enzyme